MSSKNVKPLGPGCLVLFALPFLVTGFVMGGCNAWTALKVRDAQRWVDVPATILTAEISRGRKGARQALATYEYQYEGQSYTGDKVSLHHGSDSLGKFQTRAHEELQRHRQAGRPFRCYVNPRNPAESVLYRDARWQRMLLFSGVAAVFGSAGVGFLIAAVITRLHASGPAPGADLNARPWERRADWAAGRVGPTDTARAAVPATTGVAVWWLLATAPLVATFPLLRQEVDSWWSWLLLALPAVGVLIATWAGYLAVRQRRFGESIFEMASVPGVVGGPLSGVIRIPKLLRPDNGFRVRLYCMSQSKNRKGSDEHERAIWQEEQYIPQAMDDGATGVAVPVLLAIPYSAKPTSSADELPRIRWLLEVFAELPGVNYKTEFEVPVFETAESSAEFALDPQLAAQYAAPADNELFLREAGIIKEPGPDGGVRLTFPAARNPGSALVATVAAAMFCGGAWLTFDKGVFLLVPILLGLVGLVFTLVALDSWFYRSVVDASARGLTIRGGLLGMGRERSYSPDEILRFRSAESMASGKHVWCTISVVTRDDKPRTIGKDIASKLAQRAVVEELNTALGRNFEVVKKKSKIKPEQ